MRNDIFVKESKRSAIASFHAMATLVEANRLESEGREIFHLEIGEPAVTTPEPVREAARRMLAGEGIGYTESLGQPALCAAISMHYQNFYGIEVPPERIAVTFGASGAFVIAFLALFDPGDRVALAAPGYPAYRNVLEALGVEVVTILGERESGFQPLARLLEPYANDLDGVVLASPANPTGSVMPRSDVEELVAFARERNIRIVADEIYHGIVYGEGLPTILSMESNAVVVNSFSKYFAMTGWRLGWFVFPPELAGAVERLSMNLFLCASSIAQTAACEVFNCYEELDSNVARYRANRDLLLRKLPEAGLSRIAIADGAFYLYADISDLAEDSAKFAQALLHETGVAVTPGIDFDTERGHRFIRLSYAGASETIAAAAERLGAWQPGNV